MRTRIEHWTHIPTKYRHQAYRQLTQECLDAGMTDPHLIARHIHLIEENPIRLTLSRFGRLIDVRKERKG